MRKFLLAIVISCHFSAMAGAATIEELHEMSAGNDVTQLTEHVRLLAQLAKTEIDAHGIEAVEDKFRETPWRRVANGLHLWGVTTRGVAWFDAGHPELEGLDVSEMSDLHGRSWSALAVASADGTGAEVFEITFPHPILKRAARGLHNCFRIRESDRVLCAGAFLDSE